MSLQSPRNDHGRMVEGAGRRIGFLWRLGPGRGQGWTPEDPRSGQDGAGRTRVGDTESAGERWWLSWQWGVGQYGAGGRDHGAPGPYRCWAWTRSARCPSWRVSGRTPTGTGSTGGRPWPRPGSVRPPGPDTAPERCTPARPASAGLAPTRAPPPCRCPPKPCPGRRR